MKEIGRRLESGERKSQEVDGNGRQETGNRVIAASHEPRAASLQLFEEIGGRKREPGNQKMEMEKWKSKEV